ncbi:hypothetical protein CTAYLR_009346 [Chrysophaeum taylorii]|uniref:RRM domain-containing protein n=1 Tax=Chrysophaeum taylorii TaxID=2483200 RepID=A0AAD7UA43_9STRA|nr:hypothetical protein CTAYLR_009346 [Chrysophaeum taylorii]
MATVIVKGLDEDTTYDSLRRVLADVGPVRRTDVIRGRGFGFVKFVDPSDAKRAISLSRRDGFQVDGKRVIVEPAREKSDNTRVRVWGNPDLGELKVLSVERKGDDAVVATFETPREALRAARKLPKARLETLVRPCRLIVRNLKFSTTDHALRAAFEAYGPLSEARVVRNGDESRGFGFVEFCCKRDAEAALKEKSHFIDSREVAVDRALGKHEFQNQPRKRANRDDDDDDDEADEEEADEDDDDEADKDEDDVEDDKDDEDFQDDEEADKDEDDVEDDEDDQEDDAEADEDDDDRDDDDQDDGEDKDDGKKKNCRGDAALGRTLFVRNVAFDSSVGAMRAFFSKLAAVESVHLVRDPETSLPRGTAFVKLKEDAKRLVGTHIMKGRELRVDVALPEAPASTPSREREDKRHLGLADEGLVSRGDPAAREVPEAELVKRERTRRQNKSKLANPLFFVNPKRLSVRNLGRVTDKMLKKITGAEKAKMLDGFGFAEFATHEAALAALRRLNNNPKYAKFARPATDGIPRLIVEFSVENKLKAEERAANVEKARAAAAAAQRLSSKPKRKQVKDKGKGKDEDEDEPPPRKKVKFAAETSAADDVKAALRKSGAKLLRL